MKKLLISILILLAFALNVEARMNVGIVGGSVAVAGCTDANPAGTCTGFLVCQNFETTAEVCTTCSEDNSESWVKALTGNGAATVDSTSSPLRGSQSALLTRGTGTAFLRRDFTASDTIYGFARLQLVDGRPATGQNTILFNNGTSNYGYIYLSTAGKFRIYQGTAYKETVAALADGATGTLYIWFYYSKESIEGAADGTYGIKVGTTRTFDAWDQEGTNGTSVQQINRIQINDQYINGITIDQVLVKDTAIGTVCE
jgi:hypothetical protein